jgi:hypothetical protein
MGCYVDSDPGETRASAEQILDWLGSVQQESLRVIDTDLTNARQHFRSIHELGNCLDPHHPGHVDEAAHGGVVQRVVDHVADEAAVDLQQIDLEVLQVTERRSPGPKVGG